MILNFVFQYKISNLTYKERNNQNNYRNISIYLVLMASFFFEKFVMAGRQSCKAVEADILAAA